MNKKIYYLCSCGEEFPSTISTWKILKHLLNDIRKFGAIPHIERIEEIYG
jgi:hypothetical protein